MWIYFSESFLNNDKYGISVNLGISFNSTSFLKYLQSLFPEIKHWDIVLSECDEHMNNSLKMFYLAKFILTNVNKICTKWDLQVWKFWINHYKKDTFNHKLTKTVEKTQPKRKSVKDSLRTIITQSALYKQHCIP